ncbi:uncharacterized protein C2845_PM02G07840 [Panicum miliaceum]|uniref:Uncharacterized protein n=1 Tax=Panicum miliaceum TaxID=4540 RepID=A0A3L6S7P3_PANMI|nr:uncharacterized protein C2845_PM02G07840 [Panicum miliaceum]
MVQEEKLVNHCDMELMKMAMLRHEQTFRQQVHELHRLYRVQKQLMMSGGMSRPPSELISCRRHQNRRGRQPRRALDLGLHLPADDYILVAGADNTTPPSPRQEDGLELTLAVGSVSASSRRKRRDEDTGAPLGSDCSGGSLTSTSSSTGTASGSPQHRRAVPASRLQEGAAAVLKQPQPQPRSPWLVQCLSLKMA